MRVIFCYLKIYDDAIIKKFVKNFYKSTEVEFISGLITQSKARPVLCFHLCSRWPILYLSRNHKRVQVQLWFSNYLMKNLWEFAEFSQIPYAKVYFHDLTLHLSPVKPSINIWTRKFTEKKCFIRFTRPHELFYKFTVRDFQSK